MMNRFNWSTNCLSLIFAHLMISYIMMFIIMWHVARGTASIKKFAIFLVINEVINTSVKVCFAAATM